MSTPLITVSAPVARAIRDLRAGASAIPAGARLTGSVKLVAACAVFAGAIALPHNVFADGGRGGNGGFVPPARGPGLGGNGGGAGVAGSDGVLPYAANNGGGGGGGGGAGGASGGSGGAAANGAVPGGLPGQDGASSSALGVGAGGGGGGAGGANGASMPGAGDIASPIVGGAGGNAGNGGATSGALAAGGGGGGGGSGGFGVLVSGSGTILNNSTVTGGLGGNGGNGGSATGGGLGSPSVGGDGGVGGGGGDGVNLIATGAALTNTGTIRGGDGGAGGAGGDTTGVGGGLRAGGAGGNGGQGGAGVSFGATGGFLTNSGTIEGGNGALGGAGGAGQAAGPNGVDGPGGVGVSGAGLTIVNSGAIFGGLATDGINLANAIVFTGGANTLTLLPGSVLAGNIDVAGSVTFNQTSAVTLTSAITGSGSVIQNGTGALILTANNTYAGGTSIDLGTLAVFADSNLGASAGGLTFDGGTLKFLSGFSTGRAVALGAGGGVIDTAGQAATLTGAITGSGGLTKIGAGVLTLSGSSSYAGATAINGGTLRAGVSNAFAHASAFTVASGATLDLNNFDQTIGSIRGDGAVTLGSATLTTGADGSDTTFAGVISGGAGGLTKVGAGVFELSGTSSYAGPTTIVQGALEDGSHDSFAPLSAVTVAAGATLHFDGVSDTIGSLAGAGSVILEPGTLFIGKDNTSTTFSGAISGSGGLAKIGAGAFTVSGVSSYTGATTVAAGILQAGRGDAFAQQSAFTVASGATLDLNNFDQTIGSLAGAGGVTLGAAVLHTGGDNSSTTFSGVISGDGSLAKDGRGVLTLSGANAYTLTTFLDAGALAVSSDANLGAPSAALSFNGGTLQFLRGFSSNRVVSFSIGGGSIDTDGNSATLAGSITGSGGLTKIGAGVLTLSGPSTYLGPTFVTAGVLQAGAADVFARQSAFTIAAGATLDLNNFDQSSGIGSLAGAGGVSLGSGTLTTGNDGASTTFSGAITGGGGLTKIGSGAFTLAGTSGYTGATTVSGGTLLVNGSLGATATTVSSGADLGGSGSIGGPVTIANGAALLGLQGQTLTMGALSLSANSNVDVSLGGPGPTPLFDVKGDLTLGGLLNVNAIGGVGVYRLMQYDGALNGGGLVIGSAPTGVNASDLFVQTAIARQVNLVNSAGQTLTFWDGGNPANQNNGVVDGGAGVWNRTNSNWTTADGAINSPMKPVPGFAVFAAAPGVVTVDDSGGPTAATGMQFAVDGYRLQGDAITLAPGEDTIRVGDGTAAGANYTATIAASLTGSGGLVKSDLGALVLAGVNDYAGGTTVAGGALSLTNGAAIGSGPLALSAGVTLDLAGSFTLANDATLAGASIVNVGAGNVAALSGAISDGATAGALEKTGLGTLKLSGANAYSGGTTLTGGVLQVTNNNSLGSGAVTFNGGVLQAGSDGLSFGNAVAINAAGAAIDTNGDRLTLSGAIADGQGSGSLTKIGLGVLRLTGMSSYSGATNVDAGTLQAGAVGAFAPLSSFVVASGATLDVNGFDETIGSLSGAGAVALGSATLTVGQDNASTTFSGSITGSGGLTKIGAGVLTLAGTSGYGGATDVEVGTLQAGAVGAFAPLSGFMVASGATLDLNGFDETIGSLSGAGAVALGSATLTVGKDNTSTTFSGAISGAGGLAKIGAGVLTLSGPSAYLGPTFVTAGVLQAGAADVFARQSAFTIAAGATLDLNNFDQSSGIGSLAGAGAVSLGSGTLTTGNDGASTTFSGAITGGGGLTKIGSGAFTLAGTSSFTGATTVSGGTLLVNGSIANSVANISSGATLGGKGTIGGLIANSGSMISPGLETPFTTLSVAGNARFEPGSTFLVNANAQGQSDKVAIGGVASLSGGTVDVLAAPGAYTPATRLTILTAARGLAGTFGSLTTSSPLSQAFAFLTPSLSYDANDVVLGFEQTTSFASIAVSPNQAAVGAALQELGLGNPLYDAVVGQSAAGARQALDALSGEIYPSAVSAAFEDSRLPREAILGRLSEPYAAPWPSSSATPVSAYPADPLGEERAAGELRSAQPQPYGFWGQAFGDWGHIASNGDAASLSRSTSGFILGGDATMLGYGGGDWRFGAAGGYTYDSLSVGQRGSSGHFESAFGALYGGASFSALQLRAGAIYGLNTTAARRQIVFPGFADGVSSNERGSTAQAFGEAGYRIDLSASNFPGLDLSRSALEPFVGAAAIHIRQNGFVENGGPAALIGFGQSHDLATTTIGLRAQTGFALSWPVTAQALIGWRRAYGALAPTALMSFQGAAQPFSVAGVPIDRDALLAEVSFDYAISPAVKLGVSYSGQVGARASDNAVKGHFDVEF